MNTFAKSSFTRHLEATTSSTNVRSLAPGRAWSSRSFLSHVDRSSGRGMGGRRLWWKTLDESLFWPTWLYRNSIRRYRRRLI
jgi:hypothetical protein